MKYRPLGPDLKRMYRRFIETSEELKRMGFPTVKVGIYSHGILEVRIPVIIRISFYQDQNLIKPSDLIRESNQWYDIPVKDGTTLEQGKSQVDAILEVYMTWTLKAGQWPPHMKAIDNGGGEN